MNILTIGAIIKKERTACGLSQKALAESSHVSRVTIVNLESGKVGDIGAIKLSEIAEIIGIPMFSTGNKMDFIKMSVSNINTSYKTSMTGADLEKFMLSGKTEPGYEGQVMHLIDETPISLIAGAIKQLAENKSINAKMVWKNLARVATEIKSPNKFWNAVGKDNQLEAAKRVQQALSRALVSSGARTQESMFFISPDIARSLKIRHRSEEF